MADVTQGADSAKLENQRIARYEMSAKQAGMGDEINELKGWLIEKGFFRLPASIKFHGKKEGDLFEHSMAVTEELMSLTKLNYLKWQDQRSPWLIGMHHDICKLFMYKEDPTKGNGFAYSNSERFLPGHGEVSVMYLQNFIKLTPEEMMCIRWHMGAYDDKENWEYMGRTIHQYPNILYTSLADMLASNAREI